MSDRREFGGFAFPDGKSTLDRPSVWKAFVKHLAGPDGHEITITAHRRRAKKSSAQRRGFHSMIAPWARDEGHDVTELKRDLMGVIFGWSEKASPLSQSRIPLREHTEDLDMKDYSFLMERTMEIAAETGYVLVAPDEWRQAQEKAAKQEAHRRGARAARAGTGRGTSDRSSGSDPARVGVQPAATTGRPA